VHVLRRDPHRIEPSALMTLPRDAGAFEEHALEVHDHRVAGHVADQLPAAVAELGREVELEADAQLDNHVELQRVFSVLMVGS
jgi:hypothetical protein